MSRDVIFAIVTFLGGSLVSLTNALIAAKALKTGKSGFQVVRSILNIGYLTAVFFITKNMDCNVAWPLIGAAVGLTVPSVLFALEIAKHQKEGDGK